MIVTRMMWAAAAKTVKMMGLEGCAFDHQLGYKNFISIWIIEDGGWVKKEE
jgi:hypothetical protein